jgi:hypothetical protein
MKFKIPLSCTDAASCTDFAASISPAPPDATTTCAVPTNDICDCSLIFSGPMTSTDSGTFTYDGNTLTTTSDIGGTPTSAPYCVLGNALHILTRNDTTGAIDGEIVAIRNN